MFSSSRFISNEYFCFVFYLVYYFYNLFYLFIHLFIKFQLIYSSAKAALDMVTKTSALELGPKGIRVNSVK